MPVRIGMYSKVGTWIVDSTPAGMEKSLAEEAENFARYIIDLLFLGQISERCCDPLCPARLVPYTPKNLMNRVASASWLD